MTSGFIQYAFALWTIGLVWLYVIALTSFRRKKPLNDMSISEERTLLELISNLGVGPFFIVWLLVTPAIFGDHDVPFDIGFLSFPYWPENLLCIAIMLVLSYLLVRLMIKKRRSVAP